MDQADTAARLRQLGLSEKEIDTYLTILEHGEATATTVADDAGVSKRYVYSVGESLEDRGFVAMNDHAAPTTLRAHPPEAVVERLTDELEALEPALTDRYGDVPDRPQEFDVVKSRTTVLKRVDELLASADEEVTLSLPADLLGSVADRLRETVDRGVLVVLLVSGADALPSARVEGLASVARVWEEDAPLIVTADRRLGLSAPHEMLARSTSDEQAIAIAQAQLVPIIVGSFFGNYWPMADQTYVTDPAPLPATYGGFRHAVLQAKLHLDAGTDVRVQAEARQVRTDDYDAVEGPLVDVRQSLVEPTGDGFAVENALVVRTDGGTVTLGGEGAFVEDYETKSVTLAAAE